MRLLLALLLFATPATAWEAGRAGRLCTLTHAESHVLTRLTYDPAGPLYTITLTLPGGAWIDSPTFSIRFDGPRAMTITTDRHALDGRALTVTDTGFGNVLDGLQYNRTATARLGAHRIAIPLDGVAPEVEAFRACTEARPYA